MCWRFWSQRAIEQSLNAVNLALLPCRSVRIRGWTPYLATHLPYRHWLDRKLATRDTCLTCNRRGINFLPLMAFCSVPALPNTYAASSRRFWQISGTKGVCSRLLCGLIHTCAVHEQGDVRCFACAKAKSLLQNKQPCMPFV